MGQLPAPPPRRSGIPPKHLMTMLATLMLNKRLQQRAPTTQPTPLSQPGMQEPGNRMADLARMQLTMGRQKPPMY